MSQIWFIHGAESTPLCFTWLKQNLDMHCSVDVSYKTSTPLRHTIDWVAEEISKCDEPPIIIGHSLGGIIATCVAKKVPISKVVTMSTPFGGSFAATIVRWFMPSQLMNDIAMQSPVLASLRRNPPTVPILSFVTDSNLIVIGQKTDGVVTVSSQTALEGPVYITVNYNHFEVLLAKPVADMINEFVKEI